MKDQSNSPTSSLSNQERELQQALGASPPPAPRRSDRAFMSSVTDRMMADRMQAGERRGAMRARWFWVPVAMAGVTALLMVAMPLGREVGDGPGRSGSGEELYALSMAALSGPSTGLEIDAFDLAIDEEISPFDEESTDDDDDDDDDGDDDDDDDGRKFKEEADVNDGDEDLHVFALVDAMQEMEDAELLAFVLLLDEGTSL